MTRVYRRSVDNDVSAFVCPHRSFAWRDLLTKREWNKMGRRRPRANNRGPECFVTISVARSLGCEFGRTYLRLDDNQKSPFFVFFFLLDSFSCYCCFCFLVFSKPIMHSKNSRRHELGALFNTFYFSFSAANWRIPTLLIFFSVYTVVFTLKQSIDRMKMK